MCRPESFLNVLLLRSPVYRAAALGFRNSYVISTTEVVNGLGYLFYHYVKVSLFLDLLQSLERTPSE